MVHRLCVSEDPSFVVFIPSALKNGLGMRLSTHGSADCPRGLCYGGGIQTIELLPYTYYID